jgi:sarcosine oxidase subunit gamma
VFVVDPIVLLAETPFAGLLKPAGDKRDPGVTIREIRHLQIATVIARGPVPGLIDLPRRSMRNGTEYLGVGPGKWLAFGPVAPDIAASASVIDQSGGYGVLEISGRDAVATLEKGIGVDLHPREFAPDAVAVTAIAHMGVILWRGTGDAFRLAVFRSNAASFWHWLETSAALFGMRIAKN